MKRRLICMLCALLVVACSKRSQDQFPGPTGLQQSGWSDELLTEHVRSCVQNYVVEDIEPESHCRCYVYGYANEMTPQQVDASIDPYSPGAQVLERIFQGCAN